MHWFVKIAGIAAFAAALAGQVSLADEPKKRAKVDKPKSGKTTELNIPIPVGHAAEGLKIPSFDNQGKLQMQFQIDNARRLDDDHLAMAMAKVETYDESGNPDMTIELPNSVLDLKTRVVRSDDPVKIRRSDFELTGDTMVFNTQTRQARFVGNVRMLIFDSAEIAAPSSETNAGSNDAAEASGGER